MISLKYLYRRTYEQYLLWRLSKVLRLELAGREKKNLLNFIISPGRSGTTLLRKHLLDKTSIHIPPESSSLIIEIAKIYLKYPLWNCKVVESIKAFNFLGLNQFWKIDMEELKDDLLKLDKRQQNLQSLIVQFYKFHLNKYNLDANIIVDKSPFLSQNMKWLVTIFPDSKYVFLIRNPFDVTYSRMTNFGESINGASNKWVWAVKEYNTYFPYLDWRLVFYEKLVERFDENLEQVCHHFGGELLETKRKVELGEESLKHHSKVFRKIERKKKAIFMTGDHLYLKKKFSKIKKGEIRDYYIN